MFCLRVSWFNRRGVPHPLLMPPGVHGQGVASQCLGFYDEIGTRAAESEGTDQPRHPDHRVRRLRRLRHRGDQRLDVEAGSVNRTPGCDADGPREDHPAEDAPKMQPHQPKPCPTAWAGKVTVSVRCLSGAVQCRRYAAAVSLTALWTAVCSSVFSGQTSPTTPAASSGAAADIVMVPEATASTVEPRIINPWPVVTWPSQDFNDLFKLRSPNTGVLIAASEISPFQRIASRFYCLYPPGPERDKLPLRPRGNKTGANA